VPPESYAELARVKASRQIWEVQCHGVTLVRTLRDYRRLGAIAMECWPSPSKVIVQRPRMFNPARCVEVFQPLPSATIGMCTDTRRSDPAGIAKACVVFARTRAI
jgi:hypothetical protein